MPDTIPGLTELKRNRNGKVYTIIARGDGSEAASVLSPYEPLFMDVLPLTLEEIFIHEMGGTDHGGLLQ